MRQAAASPEGDAAADPVECEVTCSAEDDFMVLEAGPAQAKKDATAAIGLGALLVAGAAAISHDWVADHTTVALWGVFGVGYLGIILEEEMAYNKAGVALLMAVSLWTIRALSGDPGVDGALDETVASVSQIVFFLMGAMTIVETVDAHQGFKIVTDVINTKSNKTLLWVIGLITFFMSAILDNLTSTIVMVSLLRKLVDDPERRRFFGAIVVIAANAGGAWTPIGDVTTTMLWINNNISTLPTMKDLFLPSLVSLVVPVALVSAFADEAQGEASGPALGTSDALAPRGNLIFATGLGALVFVPVFKNLTGLPPYLGMLCGLGVLWLLTDAIHYGEDRPKLQVPKALTKIDTEGVLFFLGILMSVGALESAGLLKDLAVWLDQTVGNQEVIAGAIGLVSALINNVPLVAATMGMYDIGAFPADSELWQLIAYCAGTGGSILIIGSAAGVAFMGMEKADFGWYFRKISPWALAGYLGGMGVYLLESKFLLGAAEVTATLPAALPLLPGGGP